MSTSGERRAHGKRRGYCPDCNSEWVDQWGEVHPAPPEPDGSCYWCDERDAIADEGVIGYHADTPAVVDEQPQRSGYAQSLLDSVRKWGAKV